MSLTLEQSQTLIAAAHEHAYTSGLKVTVAVVDEGGLLKALGRMDGAPPLSAQIAEAQRPGARRGTRRGARLGARRAAEGLLAALKAGADMPMNGMGPLAPYPLSPSSPSQVKVSGERALSVAPTARCRPRGVPTVEFVPAQGTNSTFDRRVSSLSAHARRSRQSASRRRRHGPTLPKLCQGCATLRGHA
jgi:Haem-degrading